MRKRTICHEPSMIKCSFAFPSRVREVYTSVERIHYSPLWVDGSRGDAGHSLLGLRAYYMARWQQTVKGGAPYQNGPCKAGGQRRRRIITVSLSLLLSPQEMSAERKQTPQVVESHRSR